jgi:L-serine dehydratase
LVISHNDRPGMIADVADVLRRDMINIGHMDVDRKERSGDAMTIIEVDSPINDELLREISALTSVQAVKKVDLTERG